MPNNYHKVDISDMLSVATTKERVRLSMISDIDLMKKLARQWCVKNGYNLGNYIGKYCWDATKEK